VAYVQEVDRENAKVMLDTLHMNIEEDSIREQSEPQVPCWDIIIPPKSKQSHPDTLLSISILFEEESRCSLSIRSLFVISLKTDLARKALKEGIIWGNKILQENGLSVN